MAAQLSSSSPLRLLFLLEAGVTFAGGTAMLAFPSNILRNLTNPALTFPMTSTNEPSAASVQMLQWLGAFNYILCVPLVLGAPENTRAKASRKITYQMLGFGELFLTSVMLWQAQGPDAAGAISRKSLLVSAAVLLGTLLGRGWILGFRPEWFEDARGPSHKRRSSNR